jgi:uncharacterized phage protein (TIGR01671 family)
MRSGKDMQSVSNFMSLADGRIYSDQLTGNMTPEIQDRWILMQYTGLKDRNGKEIYENDGLRIEDHTFSPMDFVVTWSEVNHCWWLSSVEKDEYGYPKQSLSFSQLNGFESDAEVIGNIFENPELSGGK